MSRLRVQMRPHRGIEPEMTLKRSLRAMKRRDNDAKPYPGKTDAGRKCGTGHAGSLPA
jgi:hypothetical protein